MSHMLLFLSTSLNIMNRGAAILAVTVWRSLRRSLLGAWEPWWKVPTSRTISIGLPLGKERGDWRRSHSICVGVGTSTRTWYQEVPQKCYPSRTSLKIPNLTESPCHWWTCVLTMGVTAHGSPLVCHAYVHPHGIPTRLQGTCGGLCPSSESAGTHQNCIILVSTP
jgi:hypothetical protein